MKHARDRCWEDDQHTQKFDVIIELIRRMQIDNTSQSKDCDVIFESL